MYRKAAQSSIRSLGCLRHLHPLRCPPRTVSGACKAILIPSSTSSILQCRPYSLSNDESGQGATAISGNATNTTLEETTNESSNKDLVDHPGIDIIRELGNKRKNRREYFWNTRIKEDFEFSLSEAQMHADTIMKGPAEVARMFLGRELTIKSMEMMKMAERSITDAGNVDSSFHNQKAVIRYGPSWLATLKLGERMDEETLKMIEEGDRLVRNPENVVRAASSPILTGYPRGMLPDVLVDSIIALIGRNETFLGEDRMPVQFLPGGPYEVAIKHIGKPITLEFGEAMKNSEPRLENGELNPLGPYTALIRPWLIALDLMEPPSINKTLLEESLELVSPSTINDFYIARTAHGEKILKTLKENTFEGSITDGPLEFITSMQGKPMSYDIIRGVLKSQKRFLRMSGVPKDGPYFAWTPAGNLTSRYNLRSAIDPNFGKDAIADSVNNPKVYTIIPPARKFNQRLLSLIEIWERHWRKNIINPGTVPGDLAASPTILARKFLGHEIDEQMYEQVLAEENKFTGGDSEHGDEYGPASIIRGSQLVLKTDWAIEAVAHKDKKPAKGTYESVLERIDLTRQRRGNHIAHLEKAKAAIASTNNYRNRLKEKRDKEQAEGKVLTPEEEERYDAREKQMEEYLEKNQTAAGRLEVARSVAQMGLAKLERSVSEAMALGSLTEKEMELAAKLGFGPDGQLTPPSTDSEEA